MSQFADSTISAGLQGLTQIQLLVGGDGSGSKGLIGPYGTIQQAITAIPAGTTSTNERKVYTVLIPPGTYDEDITIDITNRHIELCALGAVNIGLFNNTFWAASNTRNITVINSLGNIDSIRSTLGIGTYLPVGTAQTTHPAYSTSFRLSGSIIYQTMPVGFNDTELYLDADIFGDVDTSAFATHNFHLYFNRCHIRGQVKGTRNLIQWADWCVFGGLVTGSAYSTLRDSVFAAGMTVSSASGGGVKPFGMVGCDFTGTFTGPANSMVLDSTSNYFFVKNGASLAGGATQVMMENGAGGGITQLTGDVTAGPGSGSQVATIANLAVSTAKIANNAVDNTKLAQMAANTVKANITGSTANATDASLTATATNNSVAQRDSSGNLVATAMITTTVKPADGAGTAITVTGGTAASNGNGGNATFRGATGSGTGTGGNGGQVNIIGADAGGDNTANQSGGGVTLTGGASKGSSQGGGLTVNLGTGGPGTGTAGATGGTGNYNAGTGGVGSATSGAGGNTTLNAGSGGAGVAGGNGGTATLHGGNGGTGSASGGNGGPANVSGGSPANFAGSAGGSVSLAAAAGSNTGAGGAGGTATVTGGNAGGDNTGSTAGGNVTLTAGNSKGSSNGAQVNLNAGAGGVGTGATGATGGTINIASGTGGANAGSSGAGGDLNFSAGAGGGSGTPGAGGNIVFKTASTTSQVEHFRVRNTGNAAVTAGSFEVVTAGQGLQVKGGSNCKLGTSALTAGTVTVANTAVTANSRIFLTAQNNAGTPGFLSITTITAGTSFVVKSSSNTDTSTVAWFIVESI